MSREKVGMIAVDSGQVMVGDPCYLSEWKDNEFNCDNMEKTAYTYTYHGACSATCGMQGAGVLGNVSAVACATAYGDGSYPVYVERNSTGAIVRLTVEFDEHNDEEDDR
jgi:hypothetical protein